MPYEVISRAGEFCVVKQGTDKELGCHPTKEKAMAQMRALYANEPEAGKAGEVKAEPMDTSHLEQWLKGEIPRRILVLPFGGPIPSAKTPLGVDLDDEWFDEDTDYIGPYPALKASRERLIDWHHTTGASTAGFRDPVNDTMKGALLGRIVLDDAPDTVTLEGTPLAGIWADWWTKFGNTGRRALISRLEQAGVPLYGSTQPVYAGVHKADSGYIDRWPIQWHTITTNPRNHLAAVPPLKAVLTADLPFDEVSIEALRAAMVGLEDLSADLLATSQRGERAAKARRLSDVRTEAERLLQRVRAQSEQSGVTIQ